MRNLKEKIGNHFEAEEERLDEELEETVWVRQARKRDLRNIKWPIKEIW